MARSKELHFSKRRKTISGQIIKETIIWLMELLLVIFIAYLLVTFFGTRSQVIGSSMEPTLTSEDQVLVNRFSYIVSHPKRGDVVLFLPNGNEKTHYYIRRVVAIPGDRLVITDGKLYVNGELVTTPEGVENMTNAGIAGQEISLDFDEYFVLGDNRNNSEDSRSANIGIVKKEYITGKAWFRFTSIRNMNFIK